MRNGGAQRPCHRDSVPLAAAGVCVWGAQRPTARTRAACRVPALGACTSFLGAAMRQWERILSHPAGPALHPRHQIRLGSQLDIPVLGCSETDHRPTAQRGPEYPLLQPPSSSQSAALSPMSPVPRDWASDLGKPLANPAPALWLYLFINRPISHLAPAQSSTPKRQMQPRDSLSS